MSYLRPQPERGDSKFFCIELPCKIHFASDQKTGDGRKDRWRRPMCNTRIFKSGMNRHCVSDPALVTCKHCLARMTSHND